MKDALGLCVAPSSSLQANTVLAKTLNSFTYAAQYGDQYAELGVNTTVDGLTAVVRRVLAAPGSDQLLALKEANTMYAEYNGAKCLDWVPARGPFPWLWCNYFPYPAVQSQAGSIFGETRVDKGFLRINDAMCQETFGINSSEDGLAYQLSLGADPETLRKTERLLLWYGLYDPVTAMGTGFWDSSGNANDSQVIFTSGAQHTQDVFAPIAMPRNLTALAADQHREKETVMAWLGIA